jgi:hypothetical protein
MVYKFAGFLWSVGIRWKTARQMLFYCNQYCYEDGFDPLVRMYCTSISGARTTAVTAARIGIDEVRQMHGSSARSYLRECDGHL